MYLVASGEVEVELSHGNKVLGVGAYFGEMGMCVCVCVNMMHVCMYVCIYMCVYVCMYVYVYIYIYVCVFTTAFISQLLLLTAHCIDYVCVCLFPHTHTHTHTHINTVLLAANEWEIVRTASIFAKTFVQLMSLSKKDFDDVLMCDV